MKLIALFSIFLISLNTFAVEECADLSGKYTLNLEQNCSKESYKTLVPTYADKFSSTFSLGPRASLVSFDIRKNNISIEIRQERCERLSISYDGHRHNGGFDRYDVEYNIKSKNIRKDGFIFRKQGPRLAYDIFPYYVINSLKLKRKSGGDIFIKTKDIEGGLDVVLPPYGWKDTWKGNYLNCILKKI